MRSLIRELELLSKILIPKFVKRIGYECSGRWGTLCRFKVGDTTITFGKSPEFLHGGPGMVVTISDAQGRKQIMRIEDTPLLVAQSIVFELEERWWFIPGE